MKKFAAFDIDGTLIRWQLFHAVTSVLLQKNADPKLYADIRKARLSWKKRDDPESFRHYEQALVDAYDRVVTSLSVAEYDAAVDTIFEEYKDQVYTYTRDLIRSLRAQNYFLIAISGSQKELVSKIAEYYGFDDFVGTVFVQKNGSFSGEKIVASKNKKQLLLEMIERHGLATVDSIAVGDSESDIPMLELVEQQIAFNPTQKLLERAKSLGWTIVIERKNVVYKLESQKGHSGAYILV